MRWTAFILINLICISAFSQYTTEKKSFVEHFQNGNVKSYKTVKQKKTKKPKIHDFYMRTDVKYQLYYPNGNKKLETKLIDKKGTYGRYCNEILFKQIEYYDNGQVRLERKSICDCYKEVTKTYSRSGKLLTREKIKNRWVKRKS